EVPSRDERPGKVLAMCSRCAREVLARCSRCARDVLAMCAGWLRTGCRLVWVVDPERRAVRAYRADGSVAVVGEVLA
ncbi:MAG TPA: hypothetical protein PKC83_17965, partial [Gemmatimonadaceae bacterium]|nr:hypothetical protein [Gemmatimonadaceae bacterium]